MISAYFHTPPLKYYGFEPFIFFYIELWYRVSWVVSATQNNNWCELFTFPLFIESENIFESVTKVYFCWQA